MGQFSWITQDTHHRIVNCEDYTVYLVDDKGKKWREDCYDGYGVFGGKDFYELLAEMNGYSYKEYGDNSGYIICPDSHKVNSDRVSDEFRSIGINLAFGILEDGHSEYPHGDNPNIMWPSITENGKYMGGVPESDPDQGFVIDDDDDDWFGEEYGDDYDEE